MNESNKFIDGLLASSKQPTRRRISLSTNYLIWFGLSLLITYIFSSFILGHRNDLQAQLLDAQYIVSLISILLIAISSTFSVYYLSTPRTRLKRSLFRFLLISFLLWTMSIIYLVVLEVMVIDLSRLYPLAGITCTKNIGLMGIFPTLSIFYMLKREFPTKISEVSFLATLAGASIGAFGTHFTCSTDNGTHIFVWHIAPIFILAFVGTYFGRKVLRWS